MSASNVLITDEIVAAFRAYFDAGHTQADAAALIGVSASTVGDWYKREAKTIRAKNAVKVMELLSLYLDNKPVRPVRLDPGIRNSERLRTYIKAVMFDRQLTADAVAECAQSRSERTFKRLLSGELPTWLPAELSATAIVLDIAFDALPIDSREKDMLFDPFDNGMRLHPIPLFDCKDGQCRNRVTEFISGTPRWYDAEDHMLYFREPRTKFAIDMSASDLFPTGARVIADYDSQPVEGRPALVDDGKTLQVERSWNGEGKAYPITEVTVILD